MEIRKNKERQKALDEAVSKLTEQAGLETVGFQSETDFSMPSTKTLRRIVNLSRSVLFPGYYEEAPANTYNITYHIGVGVEELHKLLVGQIVAGFNFTDEGLSEDEKVDLWDKADAIATEFVAKLPELRAVLSTDVVAAYNGDPAAKSYGEVIFCYPVLKALVNYRVAHELLKLGVPLIPRIITELAHSETGIDIHPGAVIGKYFTIDHGTGVVIGETAVIGNNVKLYQGVTLGAKSFPLDEDGNPIKGIMRHPVIEDDVIVYSNASILGRVTIGRGSVIGGNVWIVNDVPPGSKVFHDGK